jgi:P27 family predicted phage terminase small subunit
LHDRRRYEPQADGELKNIQPSAWMNARQKRLWREDLAAPPQGVLRRVDRRLFAGYIVCVDTFIEAAKAQNKSPLLDADNRPSPYLRVTRQTLEVMVRLGAELGMSPVSRTRLGTAAPVEEQKGGFEAVPPEGLRRVA